MHTATVGHAGQTVKGATRPSTWRHPAGITSRTSALTRGDGVARRTPGRRERHRDVGARRGRHVSRDPPAGPLPPEACTSRSPAIIRTRTKASMRVARVSGVRRGAAGMSPLANGALWRDSLLLDGKVGQAHRGGPLRRSHLCRVARTGSALDSEWVTVSARSGREPLGADRGERTTATGGRHRLGRSARSPADYRHAIGGRAPANRRPASSRRFRSVAILCAARRSTARYASSGAQPIRRTKDVSRRSQRAPWSGALRIRATRLPRARINPRALPDA